MKKYPIDPADDAAIRALAVRMSTAIDVHVDRAEKHLRSMIERGLIEIRRKPRRGRLQIGETVIHEGVTTTWRFADDAARTRTVIEEFYCDSGVLIDIGPGDRCTLRYANGSTCDNIYIGDLRRAS